MVLILMLKAHLSSRVKSEGRTRGMDAERVVLEQERITAFRQRNDESRAPAKQASDTCASAGDPRGLRACNPFGG
ncbi:hypothetical protein CBW52_09215 [Yersinia kristensenii]|uniref:Uncharacterized protein n=1 Tax=Yersinia kristensenii TaxID=28152 RepID=A0AB73P513_YERKR|nr:hypothetical protein CBW52_09215 [Yersinia kristensenii]PJE85211.1 hypothetical protein CU276_02510 [Yersinia kristensenii]CND89182.1 Uncharacterised protein [Yersinia kristensenii]CNG70125.1 Uncharacterised protein [Yersinia kristensenii]CNJ53400.1 Uncharacterised protein [Yersinia kristensenii]